MKKKYKNHWLSIFKHGIYFLTLEVSHELTYQTKKSHLFFGYSLIKNKSLNSYSLKKHNQNQPLNQNRKKKKIFLINE